jgi:polar amino acid transport system substrate-binding protein
MRSLLALLLLAAGLQSPASVLAPTGTLRATFLGGNPVQVRIDPATGEISGPVADLARDLAKRLGVPVQLLPAPNAGSVIERVRSGEADIGFLAFEAERAAQVDFSQPYATMMNAYLVRADSAIKASADVDRQGLKVGAVKGQSQQLFVSSNLKSARVVVMPAMPPVPDVIAMLEKGEVDAFAANRQRMVEIAEGSTKVRVLNDNFLMIGQSIVVPKGAAARLDEVNRFIADVRASGFVRSSIDRAGLTRGLEVPK